jgi:hypothetical protein
MLTLVEKILFAVAVAASLYYTWQGCSVSSKAFPAARGRRIGNWFRKKPARRWSKFFSFQPVFRFRLVPSILHGLIGWGFISLFADQPGRFDLCLQRLAAADIPGCLASCTACWRMWSTWRSWWGSWRWRFAGSFSPETLTTRLDPAGPLARGHQP